MVGVDAATIGDAAGNHPYLLSQAGVVAVTVAYVVVALGAGLFSFTRRDAS